MSKKDTARIAELNDHLRTTFCGVVMVTPGVNGSPHRDEILQAVKEFKFQGKDGDNPYGENDFGKVLVRGENYFFKIDYCDLELVNLSPNPADPGVTRRVLTIMRADEY